MYRARHRGDGRVAAVKLLHRSAWADPSFRVRFRRECDALAHLRHPHVVPVYDFGEEGGCGYLAMPLARGGSLAELLRRGPLAPERGSARSSPPPPTRWTPPTRPASCTATSRPTTSCSIPTGPGWPTSGSPAANRAATTTGDGLLIGTAGYLAPEVISGAPAGPAADRYALAAVAFRSPRRPAPLRGRRRGRAALRPRPSRPAARLAPSGAGCRAPSTRRWPAGSPRIPRPRPATARALVASLEPGHRAARRGRHARPGAARAALAAGSWPRPSCWPPASLAAGGAAAGLTMTLGGGAPASAPAPPAPAPPLSVPGPDGAPVAARHALPADLPGLPVAADSAVARVDGARVSSTPGGWTELAGRGAGAGGRRLRDRARTSWTGRRWGWRRAWGWT